MVLYTIVVHVMKWLGLTKESEVGACSSATANDSSGTSETDEEQGTATEEATDNEQTAAAGNHSRWTRFKKCLGRYVYQLPSPRPNRLKVSDHSSVHSLQTSPGPGQAGYVRHGLVDVLHPGHCERSLSGHHVRPSATSCLWVD
jgi:hypothetical protein